MRDRAISDLGLDSVSTSVREEYAGGANHL
jgi:hypothetical protein